jgi:hypothetical protein
MKKFLTFLILPLFLGSCNQSTSKEEKTYNQKEVDSLVWKNRGS